MVARLGEQHGLKVDQNVPYAELWMGDHPNGESIVVLDENTTEPISVHIAKNRKKVLGAAEPRWEHLPFLFKVLSINKALSIQAHPDKELAQQLFRSKPSVYKDGNHKPEIAIAITPMEALCGFRTYEQIVENLDKVPELAALLGEEVVKQFTTAAPDDRRAALKTLFATLINSKPEVTQSHLKALVERIHGSTEAVDCVARRVASEFPGDAGVFCIYLFNLIFLAPGEGIFLGPNEPHAYLQGDCVECMARSDNVVRAGLTPKEIDSETLIEMLTYKMEQPHIHRGDQIYKTDPCAISSYVVPVDDFYLTKCTLLQQTCIRREPLSGPRILLFLSGKGSLQYDTTGIHYTAGTVVLVYPGGGFDVNAFEETQFFEATCHCPPFKQQKL